MTATFAIASRTRSRMHPLWHRPDASVAVTEIDPGYGRLREALPASWMALARAKCTLDSIVSLGRPQIQSSAEYRARARSLFELLVSDLSEVAHRERAGGALGLARQAADAAAAAAAYVRTGTWPRTRLEPPGDEGLWLFCGPLKAWDVQENYDSLTLILGEADPVAQVTIDMVDDRIDVVRDAVAAVLGGELARDVELPAMCAVRLILAGGVSAVGHKNFAHFFPLDAPAGIVDGRDFTVLFSNVHRTRLQRCSLRLLGEIAGTVFAEPLPEVVQASIAWFRGHDLAHFWRLAGELPGRSANAALQPFERLTLEESLADILGLLSAAAVLDNDDALMTAFAAEMLRYLSRNYRDYADSAAAVLELGWLEQHTAGLAWDTPQAWLDAAMPALVSLVPLLREALATDSEGIALRLGSSVASGVAAAVRWSSVFSALPSDLDYSFG